jgi:3-oxoacyl-[acyl-carrier-protein] synthase-1
MGTMRTAAVVVGVGARTPIGLTARHTGFLYRAGAVGMVEAPLVDVNEEPITMCLVPTLDPRLVGPGRALRLAVPAMEEALAPLGDTAALLRMKLVLAVGEGLAQKRDDGVIPAAVLLNMLTNRAKELVPGIVPEVCARGAAGPGFALEGLLPSLQNGEIDAVLLGGAHSDYDPAIIAVMQEKGRLFSADNKDAMIPGESAAFAVLMRPEVARRHALEPWAQVHSVGTAFDRATPDNDESAFEAAGMTVSVRKAAAPLLEAELQVGWMLSDITFEMRRLYEWQTLIVRTHKLWCAPQLLDCPAQRMGHLGAAAIPLHIAMAAQAWHHGYAPHALAMSMTGSDPGERAAILMSEMPR